VPREKRSSLIKNKERSTSVRQMGCVTRSYRGLLRPPLLEEDDLVPGDHQEGAWEEGEEGRPEATRKKKKGKKGHEFEFQEKIPSRLGEKGGDSIPNRKKDQLHLGVLEPSNLEQRDFPIFSPPRKGPLYDKQTKEKGIRGAYFAQRKERG